MSPGAKRRWIYVKVRFEGAMGAIELDSARAPYVLTAIDGLGGADGQIYSAATPLKDGATLIGCTVQPRTITISGAIIGNDAARAELRRALTRGANAKAGAGILTIEAYGRARRISAIVERGPVFSENEGEGVEYQEFTYTMYCPSPFFESIQSKSQAMATRDGGMKFPLKLGTRFSARHNANRYMYENGGDVPCAIECEISSGAAAPTLTNIDTDEFVRVKGSIPEGKRLIIKTGFNEKEVYLLDPPSGEKVDAMGYIDLKSTFFELKTGANWLNFSAEEGTDTSVTISWRERFSGF